MNKPDRCTDGSPALRAERATGYIRDEQSTFHDREMTSSTFPNIFVSLQLTCHSRKMRGSQNNCCEMMDCSLEPEICGKSEERMPVDRQSQCLDVDITKPHR